MFERTRTTVDQEHQSPEREMSPGGAGLAGSPGRRTGAFAALLLIAGLTLSTLACGNLTAGGARGQASVAVSGDAPEESSQTSVVALEPATVSGSTSGPTSGPASGPAFRVQGPIGVGGPVEGQVKATLRVFLESADGERVALLDRNEEAAVDIEGAQEVTLGGTELETGIYPRIRIVFTNIEADVRSGLEIGGGPVTGRITVGGEELDSLVVEIDRDVEIREDEAVELLIDLNSTAWLNAASPALKTVAASIFREAVSVRVR